jgi:hypothetical protein
MITLTIPVLSGVTYIDETSRGMEPQGASGL